MIEPGDRMLLSCRGGPAPARAVSWPPPREIEVAGGIYVLIDDGPPESWIYDFVPHDR